MQKYEVLVDDFQLDERMCLKGEIVELEDEFVAPLLAEGRLTPIREEATPEEEVEPEESDPDFDAIAKDKDSDDEVAE